MFSPCPGSKITFRRVVGFVIYCQRTINRIEFVVEDKIFILAPNIMNIMTQQLMNRRNTEIGWLMIQRIFMARLISKEKF